MQGKGSEEDAKTIISFSLTDPEMNVCQGLQLPGNKLQTLHVIPTQTTLEVTNHHLTKKQKRAKLAQLQAPLLLFKIADLFQHSHFFFLFLRSLQRDFKLTLQTHYDKTMIKGQKQSGESQKCSVFHLVPYGVELLPSTCAATIRDSIFLL